jgi:hypothetical protein
MVSYSVNSVATSAACSNRVTQNQLGLSKNGRLALAVAALRCRGSLLKILGFARMRLPSAWRVTYQTSVQVFG